MNDLKIINHEGVNVTDSREVAEIIGKDHSHLMRDIKGYVSIISTNPKLDSLDFFIVDNYKDAKGEERPCYLLTKQGCEMVANKMTGKKGVLFTAEYVQAFNNMEKQVKILTPREELKLHYEVLETHQADIQEVKADIKDLKENSPLFNIECEELQKLVKKIGTKVLGGHDSVSYKDKSLRTKIYADLQSQIRREFGVGSYKAIKRCQLEEAKKIVLGYKAPIVLKDKIDLLNNQINMHSRMIM
ncbi:ORF6C domain-containing protein [Clostridium felsineum]|uniref:ORF6C domain-containing protein n=1 Tax=Clostridium felsineum TaxID=36839 RepID=UPI00098C45E2|nr:ORF6C domain-containing protein [Clostridium felsineum]URZ15301.1 hypothetical protein CLFE_013190 [Clostridium felsineum DSM 794]